MDATSLNSVARDINVNEFLQDVHGKAVATEQGLMIRRSDLKALDKKYFDKKEAHKPYKTFEEVREAIKADDEWVQLAPPPRPPIQQPGPHSPSRA